MPQREDLIRLPDPTRSPLGPGRSGRTPATTRRSPMARRALMKRRLRKRPGDVYGGPVPPPTGIDPDLFRRAILQAI